MGFSPEHSSTIGRIKNTETGYVTPQFHVVYDETFSTVTSSAADSPDAERMWVDLFTFGRDHYLPDDEELVDEGDFHWPKLTDDWLNAEQLASRKSRTGPNKSRTPPSQSSALDKPLDAPVEPAPHPEGARRSQHIRNQRVLDQAAVAIGTAMASSLTFSNPFPSASDDSDIISAFAFQATASNSRMTLIEHSPTILPGCCDWLCVISG
jgi:hypothetical protein